MPPKVTHPGVVWRPAVCSTVDLWVALAGPMRALEKPWLRRLLEVREVLMFSFDFELLEPPLSVEAYASPSPWLPAFSIANATSSIVGRDATGGVYVTCELYDGGQLCLHIDTTGRIAPLGDGLVDALALLVTLPYWHQLFADCPSGNLQAMRALAEELEREVCEDLPALPAAREELRRFLELPVLADPVQRLYELASARGNDVAVMSPHGWRYVAPMTLGGVNAR
jgi:hypothetical protein